MRIDMTRRELAAALIAVQAPPDAPLAKAGAEVLRDVEELRRFPLPPVTEPAFVFKP
jgi:hypothetical protein